MKVLQDRSITQERVINWLRKRNETLTNKQEQYKGAFRNLNKEVMALIEKLKARISARKTASSQDGFVNCHRA